MELYDYQEESVAWVRPRTRSIVAHEPGLGKTAIAILSADLPAVVAAPASVVVNWRREIELWRPGAGAAFDVFSHADPYLPYADPRRYATAIVDEVHYAKNHESRRAKVLGRLLRLAPKSIALSGTLIPNRPAELWTILRALEVTDFSWERYAARYCGAYVDPWGKLVATGATRVDELRHLLATCSIRYTKRQVAPQLPPITWRVLALNLPPGEVEKDFDVRELRYAPDSPPAREAMSLVLHDHARRKLPLALDHLDDAIREEEKLIVFAWHRDVIAALVEWAGGRGLRPVVVVGGDSPKRRQAAADAFNSDSAVRLFLGQTKAAGVGMNLPAARRVVMVEGSWVPSDLDQAAGRAHRIGQAEPVLVDVLTVDGSIDEYMLRAALSKSKTIARLLPRTPTREERRRRFGGIR